MNQSQLNIDKQAANYFRKNHKQVTGAAQAQTQRLRQRLQEERQASKRSGNQKDKDSGFGGLGALASQDSFRESNITESMKDGESQMELDDDSELGEMAANLDI